MYVSVHGGRCETEIVGGRVRLHFAVDWSVFTLQRKNPRNIIGIGHLSDEYDSRQTKLC